MSEEVTIRKYKNTDYVQLREIHDGVRTQELIVGSAVELYVPLEEVIYKGELFLETIYAAEINSHVVRPIVFRKNEPDYTYVLKEYQRKGVGGKLLDIAIPYLERPVSLEVLPTNVRVKGLYGSRGFVEKTKEKMILK